MADRLKITPGRPEVPTHLDRLHAHLNEVREMGKAAIERTKNNGNGYHKPPDFKGQRLGDIVGPKDRVITSEPELHQSGNGKLSHTMVLETRVSARVLEPGGFSVAELASAALAEH